MKIAMPDAVIRSVSTYDARFPLPPGAGTDSVHTNSEYSFAVTSLAGENGFYARQRLSAGDIDAADASVRTRAAQNARVEHSRKENVAGVGSGAGDAFESVDAGRSMADRIERVHAFLRALVESVLAAAITDST